MDHRKSGTDQRLHESRTALHSNATSLHPAFYSLHSFCTSPSLRFLGRSEDKYIDLIMQYVNPGTARGPIWKLRRRVHHLTCAIIKWAAPSSSSYAIMRRKVVIGVQNRKRGMVSQAYAAKESQVLLIRKWRIQIKADRGRQDSRSL